MSSLASRRIEIATEAMKTILAAMQDDMGRANPSQMEKIIDHIGTASFKIAESMMRHVEQKPPVSIEPQKAAFDATAEEALCREKFEKFSKAMGYGDAYTFERHPNGDYSEAYLYQRWQWYMQGWFERGQA